ncbi:MAG: hypothetical protein RL376_130 [Verrucomicrobiota bacterium]
MKTEKTKVAATLFLVAAAGLYFAVAKQAPRDALATPQTETAALPPKAAPKPGFPAQGVDQSWQAPAPTAKETPSVPEVNYGVTPRSTEKSLGNPQGQANLLAHQSPHKNASQISPQVQGAAFDAERWRSDPAYVAAYCAISEPSRAYASHTDPQAPSLARVSHPAPEVHHGERIELKVKTISGYPVSWFSPNLGRFAESGLTSCTTLADADGFATVTFEGVPGTIGGTEVTAASPGSSGLVKFFVETRQAQSIEQVSK